MLEGTPPPSHASLAQSAVQALRSGDARGARGAFERIVAGGRADAQVYVGLAYACRILKDRTACTAATEKALTLEPQNLRALILRADLLAEDGDARAASAFYLAAVKAAPPADRLPPDLRGEVARAKTECDRYGAHFESVLRNGLAASGLDDEVSARRFKHSLDIVFGKKKIYFQEPRYYFFPELPQIQFYDRSAFPWSTGSKPRPRTYVRS